MCNGKRLDIFPLQLGIRQGYQLLLLQFSVILEVLDSAKRQHKHPYWKGKNKTLFVENIDTENLIKSIKG
jgi:hypothetical protein